MPDISPAALAQFDQLLSTISEELDDLIKMWSTTNLKVAEHHALAGFSLALENNYEPMTLANLLAVAIRKLGNRPAGPPNFAKHPPKPTH